MNSMAKVLCIIRVSTDLQETASQKQDMLQFLTNNYHYSESDIRWLESQGASARSVNQKYLDFLADIKKILETEHINTIAMWHLNRLARVESQLQKMKEYFVDNHIQVLVKTPSITLLDENGKLNPAANIALSVFGALVSYETQEQMDKLIRGKKEAQKKGKYIGGVISLGFKLDENNFIVVDESKRFIIEKMFEMYLNGASHLQIRDYINSFGYTYLSTSIKKLLGQECYRKIIGDEKFNRVLEKKKNSIHNYSSKARLYSICEKLIVCPDCGRHFYKHGNCYRCVSLLNKYNGSDINCDNKMSLVLHRMDCIAVVSAWKWFNRYTHQNGTIRMEQVTKQLVEIPEQIDALQKQIETVDEKIERYAISYADGLISKQTRDLKIQKIKTEKQEMTQRLSNLKSRLVLLEDEKKNLEKDKITTLQNIQTLESMDKIELYNFVHQYIDRIEIKSLGKNDRLITVHSKHYDDVWMYRTIGRGNGYKLYLINPNTLDYNDLRADMTKEPRYNKHY